MGAANGGEVLGNLAALRDSTDALLLGLDAEHWKDADVRAPSLLPGWSRAHVLTHIARNAEGINRTLDGALRGQKVARYPHGQAGRAADIEAGAGRRAAELLADVRDTATDLDRIFTTLADADAWDVLAENRSAAGWVTSRWREVEIHRVDLGGNYGPQDWPEAFVAYLLPALGKQLAERTDMPLRVEVTPEGSLSSATTGRTYRTSNADADADANSEVVSGPDWAVLAWLVGRVQPARDALTAAPELPAWL
jgi:maleylpyruvate isomerase